MRNTLVISLIVLFSSAIVPAYAAKSGPVCNIESFPKYPELKINYVTEYTEWSEETALAPGMFAPHCKVHGTIGKHINFELLLPEKWNGKFAMGGGGGFVGSVVNTAATLYQALPKGYATVGTDTGHQAIQSGLEDRVVAEQFLDGHPSLEHFHDLSPVPVKVGAEHERLLVPTLPPDDHPSLDRMPRRVASPAKDAMAALLHAVPRQPP